MKLRYINPKLKNFLRNTSITLCTISLIGTISIEGYNIHLDKQLKNIEIPHKDIQVIKEYYDDLNQIPTIFVMNDSQGINLNIGFWENSYPEYLEQYLNTRLINCSSLQFNKICHIDMILDNNLSIKEIKELNNEGSKKAFSKLSDDIGLPALKPLFVFIAKSIFNQKILNNDSETYISDLLKDTKSPIIIYSSGANDLMFKANANPYSLDKYDENGEISLKYLYAEEVLCNSSAIDDTIEDIEHNFCKILSINPEAKIYVLSIYTPLSMDNENYTVFIDVINKYNCKLRELCEKYSLNYIDITELGETYNNSKYNFHIDEVGHKELACLLIREISNNIHSNNNTINYDYSYEKKRLEGCYENLVDMIENIQIIDFNNELKSYGLNVYISQINEKIRDSEICKKLK